MFLISISFNPDHNSTGHLVGDILYAGMALLIDFLMRITCFVSLIALDMVRRELCSLGDYSKCGAPPLSHYSELVNSLGSA